MENTRRTEKKGFVFIEIDNYPDIERKFINNRKVYSGTDENGTEGYVEFIGKPYDFDWGIVTWTTRLSLHTTTGKHIEDEWEQSKYISTYLDIRDWLKEFEFDIIHEYGDYSGNRFEEKKAANIYYGQ